MIKSILNGSGKITAYDPKAIEQAKFYLNDYEIEYFDNKYEALHNADAIILVTEWKEFRSLDFAKMKSLMKGNIFIDGRNQFKPELMRKNGFEYFQIGVK